MDKDIYNAFVILTDGVIDDMEETKKLIKNCSELPLSIIITGIGDMDLSDMN